ncbi:MAG: hypothetical protein JXB14_01315 [Candidatus Altiarchaeota archaeon]|nr:hypothetical protein [Candidatus Altiarchaeota archaeon]
MDKKIIHLVIVLIVALVLLVVLVSMRPQGEKPIGGDKDEHGCLIAAGYSWCEPKQKCLRTWEEPCEEGNACTDSGGTIEKAMCCKSAGDFPNLCLIGACGCGPADSHEVDICNCGEGKCWDGEACVVMVNSFGECVAAGYPVMESYPRQCRTPDGRTFIEEVAICEDRCGDGFCDDMVCLGEGCPCAETPESCPEDCAGEETCGEMSISEAIDIATNSDCTADGSLLDTHFCNENTRTWWIDLDIEQPGCAPACVINVDTGEAEINWRCTGLIAP